MLLFINLFVDGGALLEDDPQGDAFIAVRLPEEDAEALAAFLISAEASAALARLFLAGAAASSRAALPAASGLADGVQTHTTPSDHTNAPPLVV